jgi:multiple sugar transport system substrate-binding protein
VLCASQEDGLSEIELATMMGVERLALADFEESAGIHVRHRGVDWATGWNDILQTGLFQKGPDISEVGSTWIDNLKAMHALRPFQPEETQALSGSLGFLPNSWPSGEGNAPGTRYSMPWLADTRLIYYRLDLLKHAGIDEASAFTTPDALFDTLLRLRADGHRYPMAMATGGLSLHNMAGFVWGRGGHFRSPDYRKMALGEPEARQGLYDYFRLHEFIHPDARTKTYGDADRCYFNGSTAVMMGGQWLLAALNNADLVMPEVAQYSRIAPPPGIPYVGSSHLIIWRHTIHADEAFQLLRHVSSPDVMRKIFAESGAFPTRLDMLNQPPFSTDPNLRLVRDCLRHGRNFRSAHQWAGVEMRLNEMCYRLWADLFDNPGLNLAEEIEARVATTAGRLEKTLLS